MEKDDLIRALVSDSIKKLKSKAESNEKLLSDRLNTLNWFLTITALLFAFFYQEQNRESTSCMEILMALANKVNFLMIVVAFLLYKVVHESFLKNQIRLYDSLDTHHLELKYNIPKLKELHNFEALNNPPRIFVVVNFYNQFTAAEFRFYKNLDPRNVEFQRIFDKLNFLSTFLKTTYTIIFVLFATYVLQAVVLMF